jgi:NADPH:quinone reductase-like Zn-dependent oxidoreductase
MKAMMALRAHRRGGPEELVYERAAVPVVSPQEVLVAVHGAAITLTELTWNETWTTENGEDRTPVIPSHEVSGVVVQLGADVKDLSVGEEVFGLIDFRRDGAAAEFTALPGAALVRRPTSVSHVEAAAVPLAALTALQALVDVAHVQQGERVVIQGGAGGVGSFAVQLAKRLGAHVTATASRQNHELVRGLGADVVVDYPARPIDDFDGGFDVLVDTFGGPVLEPSYGLVRRGGRLVTLSHPPSQRLAKQQGITAAFFVVHSDREQLSHLSTLVDGGRLRPIIARTFPLALGRQAFTPSADAHVPGKTVLVVRP